jgi:hypothetical protein
MEFLTLSSFNPGTATPVRFTTIPVWALPLSLATTQGILSFPPGTEMFQFPDLPPLAYVFSKR